MTYTTYYTSSDVQVYFSSTESDNIIKIDTTIGISYNVNQTSTPIYDLGSRKAKFFSIGNTICNGYIMFAFTDEELLKYSINYVTGNFNTDGTSSSGDKNANVVNGKASMGTITMTASEEYSSKRYGIDKMSNQAFREKSLAQVKPTKNGSILSIGAINTPFDIKIYINNESLVRASDTKMICLKECKIVQDSFETNSGTDSFLTNGYSFVFKDVVRY